ncbi:MULTISPECIES: FAD-binding oxidoreductase [unclassified Rhizobium]|uniref:NAD(P)/FAD-dependent oxidoreductase n=1 Tax=unclassified Rhizobium TaxID=2613769 RepID=UPI00247AA7EF|nr:MULTISPECIES: FAD-binding oxidoreductase [unclassified Rhizobium]MDH7804579.1 FAD-dependent oxidoreductase domain-containing protein 1 [Rhizobium sp. AN70]
MKKSSESVIIIGGAIVGSSIAYFLREVGFSGAITVVERDPTYQQSSTALSAAAIRTQFGTPVNIHMSQFGADFFRTIKDRFGSAADIGFVERGYLILGGPEMVGVRRAGVEMQRKEGADVAALSAEEAKQLFPWLNVDDLGVATTAWRDEGWFDAWSLLSLVRTSARDRGVTYVKGHAEHVEVSGGRVVSVKLSDGTVLPADWCVNAAGASSASVVRGIGIELPVSARKRTVFSIKAPLLRDGFPMLFDTSGAWIRPEGEGFICGIAPTDENDPDATGDFEPAHELLEDVLWPALAHRIPALEQLRVERAWAGHYEVNTLDHNGIIGPHDEIPNLIFATGFSGHGVMHAPATGRGVAELVAHGEYKSIDLAPLGFGRVRSGTPLHESVVY